MSSTNDELPSPPKPRASPLDFRNTDLVSRLLAATPPYLYNMPMVPNSYFFSEMLRSFVQAKAEANRTREAPMHQRRSRKRSWTQVRNEMYQKESPKQDKPEVPSPNWGQKSPVLEKTHYYDNKRTDVPLELTMDKCMGGGKGEIEYHNQKMPPPPASMHALGDKPSIPTTTHIPMMFPNIPAQSSSQENGQNLILPPPPPIWYPPLYPAPYGIDPLHFFIDLRVSGHIYDRKNGAKEATPSPSSTQQSESTVQSQCSDKEEPPAPLHEGFKQSRHASAFSVPTQNHPKHSPMNLSSNKPTHEEHKPLKFDVKSMGFEKVYNKTSTNYIMGNIGRIYKDLDEKGRVLYKDLDEKGRVLYKEEPEEVNVEVSEVKPAEDGVEREETEEEREKRVKDLRALIGLELVVDYMNHAKPGQPQQISDDSTSENESAPSPTLEVVAVNEEIQQVL